ncbi:MAG: nucleotidyl transferase AbiEii/AbiGii toxin family protein, partial [Pseudomonadota bacterium]
FALLGHLAESGLEFVFKGGTSLLLHAPAIRRLSIDIDIICCSPAEALDRVLQQISKVAPFIDYKDDERDSHWRTMPGMEVFPTLENTGEWSRINSLRSSLPEAFWYWYQASRL